MHSCTSEAASCIGLTVGMSSSGRCCRNKKLCEAVVNISTGECCGDVSATVLLVVAVTVVLVPVDVAGLVVLIVHSVMYRNIVLCSAEA